MKGTLIFFYIFVMWLLIIAGGALIVPIIAHISIRGFGNLDSIMDSIVKASIAIMLVVLWILIMSKIKNWIFHQQMHH
ncbi:MAG: hypothetical protein KGH81_05980 [Thaumarchaeota archaeon]|nr:hypothetical protein [Nitrososphaerota archaeon]MDE1841826.1 hypothetical protein [Nitrososphaerota archaeon]MDE1878240.1 hypothetical protein [Nitrososphaerota archaeon]